MSGLLVDGALHQVADVAVVSPGQYAWARLQARDCTPRATRPNKVVLHKTKADDPEVVVPGYGPVGRAEHVARSWADDPTQSAAHLVVGSDYTACLADVVRTTAYHARLANLLSIGIEMYEERGGLVYQAIIDNTVKVCWELAKLVGIQAQCTLNQHPLTRFRDGGRALFGFFGHRNVDDSRNIWDPGNAIWHALIRSGFEAFDFQGGEDIETWKKRQRALIEAGHDLGPTGADGFPGQLTRRALEAEGYPYGLYALGRKR